MLAKKRTLGMAARNLFGWRKKEEKKKAVMDIESVEFNLHRRSKRGFTKPSGKIKINPVDYEHDFAEEANYHHYDTQARETSTSSVSINRIEKYELERLSSEPIVATAINTYCSTFSTILKPNLIQCSPECRDAIFKHLLNNTTFQDTLDKAIRHLLIHGEAFVFPSPSMSSCKEFYVGDPRVYDFIEDSYGVKTSNGVLPYGFEYVEYTFNIKDMKKQFLYDIDLFYLSVSSNHYTERGYSVVEQLSDVIYQKENISDAREERTSKSGMGIPVVTYGNDRFAPNAKQQIIAKQFIKDMFNPKVKGLPMPYTHTLKSLDEVLGLKDNAFSMETEELLNEMISGAFGIPLVVLMMTAPNKEPAKIIEAMSIYMEWRIKYIGNRLRLGDLFTTWAHSNGFPNETVYVHWGNLTPDAIKEATMRMFRLGKIGFLSPSPIFSDYVGSVLDMPYDTIKKFTIAEKIKAGEKEPVEPSTPDEVEKEVEEPPAEGEVQ